MFYWFFDEDRCVKQLLEEMYKTMANYFRRMEAERGQMQGSSWRKTQDHGQLPLQDEAELGWVKKAASFSYLRGMRADQQGASSFLRHGRVLRMLELDPLGR